MRRCHPRKRREEMTEEDIVRMALKAGISVATSDSWIPIIGPAAIERFFKLAYEAGAAAEREACAKLCEDSINLEPYQTLTKMAAAIRARGQPDPKVAHLNEWARDRLARHGIQLPDEGEEYGNPSF
jgi:hypothetical protein